MMGEKDRLGALEMGVTRQNGLPVFLPESEPERAGGR